MGDVSSQPERHTKKERPGRFHSPGPLTQVLRRPAPPTDSRSRAVDAADPRGYNQRPATAASLGLRALLTDSETPQSTSMPDDPRETTARRAIDAGDWQTARDLYEVLARETNEPEAWAGLAEAAWLQQDSRMMIDARLAAYRLHRERGNDVAAARMATALGNDFLDFRGDAAVANGWFKYARRLLKPLPPSADHARLSVWESRLALIGRQDTAEGARLAEEALQLAREINCPDVEVLATAVLRSERTPCYSGTCHTHALAQVDRPTLLHAAGSRVIVRAEPHRFQAARCQPIDSCRCAECEGFPLPLLGLPRALEPPLTARARPTQQILQPG